MTVFIENLLHILKMYLCDFGKLYMNMLEFFTINRQIVNWLGCHCEIVSREMRDQAKTWYLVWWYVFNYHGFSQLSAISANHFHLRKNEKKVKGQEIQWILIAYYYRKCQRNGRTDDELIMSMYRRFWESQMLNAKHIVTLTTPINLKLLDCFGGYIQTYIHTYVGIYKH